MSLNSNRCSIGVGTRAVLKDTFNAIKEASDKTGVPMTYMLVMAERESGFNPQARVPTSLAKSLYQFIDGTWSSMVRRYGRTDSVGTGDALTGRGSAIMGARYTQENIAVLKRVGVAEPSPGQMYMARFLGGGGAATLVKANANNPNASAADLLPSAAAANRSIFYNRDGTPKTVAEVHNGIERDMTGRANAYATQYGLPPPCERSTSSTPPSQSSSMGGTPT